jgi:hypothetical protein
MKGPCNAVSGRLPYDVPGSAFISEWPMMGFGFLRRGREVEAPAPADYWQPDSGITERIRWAYLFALESHKPKTSVFWANVIPEKQQDIHRALVSGINLPPLLGNVAETDLYFGVDDLSRQVALSGEGADPRPYSYVRLRLLVRKARTALRVPDRLRSNGFSQRSDQARDHRRSNSTFVSMRIRSPR